MGSYDGLMYDYHVSIDKYNGPRFTVFEYCRHREKSTHLLFEYVIDKPERDATIPWCKNVYTLT